jgi:hypothetical protein
MKKFKVLVACEYTGTVRDAFASVGWDAVSCDLKDSLSPGAHCIQDARFLISLNWDLLIGFPPCTYLSDVAARWRPSATRFQLMIEALQFFHDLYTAPIPYIALENPKGILSTAFRKPDQVISPHYFGGSEHKRTCLWLQNLPKLTYTSITGLFELSTLGILSPEHAFRHPSGQSAWYNNNKKERDKTFPAVALAMATQWSAYIESKSNKII